MKHCMKSIIIIIGENMNKIRIAFITSLKDGGAENIAVQLILNIDKSKFEPFVICVEEKNVYECERKLNEAGIHIYYLGYNSRPNLKAIMKLYEICNDKKPQLVHTHMSACIYAVFWVVFHNTKMVHTIHTVPKFEFSDRIKWVMKLMYRTRKVIPVGISFSIAKEAETLYKLPRNSIRVIYNGINTLKFKLNKKTNDKVVLIHIGRLCKVKNQQAIINAIVGLYNIELIIIGNGELKKSLESMVRELGLDDNVIFTGYVSNVEYWLSKADIFIMSSHYEGVPLAILEAMASGLPIISTDVGSIKEIVKENGMLVDTNDSKALKKAIKVLLCDDALRKRMGKKSLLLSKQYDIKYMVNQYENLYLKYGERNVSF